MTACQKFVVYSRPGRQNNNAYTAMLAEALENEGISVRDVGMTRVEFPLSNDLIIFHWPDEFYKHSLNTKSLISSYIRLIHLSIAHYFFGLSIVWVAHNIRPHDSSDQKSPLRWKWFLKILSGSISLSRSGHRDLLKNYPSLRKKPALITSHGHYLDRAITPPNPSRSVYPPPIRMAHLGVIRINKNLDLLAEIISKSSLPIELTIKGNCNNQDLAETLSNISHFDDRVHFVNGHMTDEDLENSTDSADVIILPYGEILNSGALFYALSRYRPVIAPKCGSIPEIQGKVGKEWIYLFDGDLSENVVSDAIRWLKQTPRSRAPDLSSQNWNNIGAEVAEFLHKIAERRYS